MAASVSDARFSTTWRLLDLIAEQADADAFQQCCKIPLSGIETVGKEDVSMNRRHFLRSAGGVSASFAFTEIRCLLAEPAPSEGWRRFEVKTRAEILKPSGATRVWLPAALLSETPFQRTLSNEFSAEGGTARIVEARADGLGIVTAEFPAGVKPVLTLTSRVATRNYNNFAHDVALPGSTDAPLGFLMYPQAETSEGRIDSLDPDNFQYEITSREIPSTAR
jgi:hypothetical protein